MTRRTFDALAIASLVIHMLIYAEGLWSIRELFYNEFGVRIVIHLLIIFGLRKYFYTDK